MKEMFRNAHGFFGLVNRSKMLDWYPWLRPFVRLLPLSLRPLDREATKLYHQERTQFKSLFDDAVKTGRANVSIPCKLQHVEPQNYLRVAVSHEKKNQKD